MKLGERWTATRKKAVLTNIDNGVISEAEAISLYGLSQEELQQWRTLGVWATKTPKASHRNPKRKRHELPPVRPVPQAEAADD